MNHRAATAPTNTIPAYVVQCGLMRTAQAQASAGMGFLHALSAADLFLVYATLGYRSVLGGTARILVDDTGKYVVSEPGSVLLTAPLVGLMAAEGEALWNSTYHVAYAAYCANRDSYVIGND